MKVAFFLPHLTDGGVTRSTTNLAQTFIKNGHAVDFVTIYATGEMAADVSKTGIKIVKLRSSRTLFSIRKLKKYIETQKPTAVISAQHYANIVSVIARARSKHKPITITTERVAISEALRHDVWYKRPVLKFLVRKCYRHADAVVANSVEGARILEKFLGWSVGKAHGIHNVLDLEKIQKMSAADLEHSFITHSEAQTIVSVGRLEHQKGFEILLKAFAKVRAEVQCSLIIIGEGGLRSPLENLAKNLAIDTATDFIGFENNPHRYVAKADLFVSSSLYEGLSNSIIEAQATGTLVVATDCPVGSKEILKNGEAGILSPVNSVDGLAAAIKKALLLPAAEKAKLTQSALDGLDRFSGNKIYEAYRSLIQSKRVVS